MPALGRSRRRRRLIRGLGARPKTPIRPLWCIRGASVHPRCSRGRATHRYRVRPEASTAAPHQAHRPFLDEPLARGVARVYPHDRLGHADRLLAPVALEADLEHALGAARDVRDLLDLRAGPDLGGDRHGRREADLVEAVVEREREAFELEHLVVQVRAERQREVAVGDRAPERRVLRALDVHVDPLVVAGDVGERVDVLLCDLVPVGGPERLALGLLELVESGDRPHGRAPYFAPCRRRSCCATPPGCSTAASTPCPTRSRAPRGGRSTRCWARSTRRCGAWTSTGRAGSSCSSGRSRRTTASRPTPTTTPRGRRCRTTWPGSGSARRTSTGRWAGR